MGAEERAVDGAAVGEKSARAGLRTAGDEDFGFRDGVVADFQRLGHVGRDGAGDYHAVGMARRGREADAEAAEVEIDVARGPQLHFDRRVAPGRDFAQLQCAGEAAADFGTHLSGVERYAGVARTDDKSFARGRADARAFAAEEAAAQVERKGRGREGSRGADGRGALGVVGVPGLGQAGTAPEFGGQLHGVEVGDRLPSVAVQYAYFWEDHF